jgi:hypothetical protein
MAEIGLSKRKRLESVSAAGTGSDRFGPGDDIADSQPWDCRGGRLHLFENSACPVIHLAALCLIMFRQHKAAESTRSEALHEFLGARAEPSSGP